MARKVYPSKIYYVNSEFLRRDWHIGPFSLDRQTSLEMKDTTATKQAMLIN